MEPVQFKGQQRFLGAPRGWDQDDTECVALPVKLSEVNGLPALTSYWKPTPEELAALNAGELVKFTIIGSGQPPVLLEVERCEEIA